MSVSGENQWIGIGEVRKPEGQRAVQYGKVRGSPVCSFEMVVPSRGGERVARMRVNVYEPKAVRYAQRHLSEGVSLRVEGELMNRRQRGSGPRLVEIRAFRIETLPKSKENDDGGSDKRS